MASKTTDLIKKQHMLDIDGIPKDKARHVYKLLQGQDITTVSQLHALSKDKRLQKQLKEAGLKDEYCTALATRFKKKGANKPPTHPKTRNPKSKHATPSPAQPLSDTKQKKKKKKKQKVEQMPQQGGAPLSDEAKAAKTKKQPRARKQDSDEPDLQRTKIKSKREEEIRAHAQRAALLEEADKKSEGKLSSRLLHGRQNSAEQAKHLWTKPTASTGSSATVGSNAAVDSLQEKQHSHNVLSKVAGAPIKACDWMIGAVDGLVLKYA